MVAADARRRETAVNRLRPPDPRPDWREFGARIRKLVEGLPERPTEIVLLHMLRKDTAAIAEADIVIAEARWEDFKRRMDAPRRRPPRAAGHDAP